MLKVYSNVKSGEVIDVQRTPTGLNLCFVYQAVLPEPISQQKGLWQGKNSYMDMASNIAKLKEHGEISGRYV